MVLVLGLAGTACASGAGRIDAPIASPPGQEIAEAQASTPSPASASNGRAERVDPRKGGLEVALGEWALTLEAQAIRPGRVTFVIENRGAMPHGFEIEAEGRDSSGSGGGDGLKVETRVLGPGEATELTLDLAPGVYKVECLVDGHDDRGMEAFLEVRRDAPLVSVQGSGREDRVAISGFAFAPAELEVRVGTEVTWTNDDPAPHTVTAEDGSFDSGTIDGGATFALVLGEPGTIVYLCAIHPDMRGRITVI